MKYAIRIVTRNFVRDFQASLLNVMGRRLGPYEKIMRQAIDECLAELGEVKNPKIEIAEMAGAFTVIVYGD